MSTRSVTGLGWAARTLPLVMGVGVLLAACATPATTSTASRPADRTASPSVSASPVSQSPPELPAGFPLMPGMVADGELPADPDLIGRWTTEANGAQVYAYLQDALPAAGYRIDLLAPGDTVAVIRFTPPDGRQLQIDLGQEGGGTSVELRLPRD
jgi:hypothetical protein